jgi:signal transduction histidine kinase
VAERAAYSLRVHLLARAAVALALLFAVAAGTIYLLLRASLLASFDAALTTQASALASLVEQDAARIKIELEPGEFPEFHREKRPHYFELLNADGTVLSRSPSLPAGATLAVPGELSGKPAFAAVRLPSGKPGRLIAYRFAPRFEDEARRGPAMEPLRTVTLAVAQPTHDLDDTLGQVALILAIVSAAAILASTGLLALVIRRGLRPLDDLAAAIERLGVHDLGGRVRLAGSAQPPRELLPVVHRLNDLLARLEAAMTREKSFTADVAHELRTPLAGLATTLEVTASRRREPGAYEEAIGKCLGIARGMESMVNNLLLMARVDAQQLQLRPEAIDLPAFLRECWGPFESRAAERGLRVEWHLSGPDGQPVRTDREKLRIVVNNLFDNAVTYADEGGRVAIETSSREIRVTNSGCTLAGQDVEKIFDRFWRADASRSTTTTGSHSGLGLTLSRNVMTALGGSLTARSNGDGAFTAVVGLPSIV